jgi:hypothetical protein
VDRHRPRPDGDATRSMVHPALADGRERQGDLDRGVPAWTPLEEQVPAELLRAEVAAWAQRIGVTPREVRIRPMRRKWASCSAGGRLTFDAALLRQPAHVRAEVIVHELLHLKVPNHGRLFRALLRAYLAQVRGSSPAAAAPSDLGLPPPRAKPRPPSRATER